MPNLALDVHASIPFSDRYNIFNRLSLVFSDKQLERHYIADYAGKVAGQARLALVLAFFLYVNFAYLDYLLVPESMIQLWTIRAVTCSIFVVAFIITFSELFKRHHQPILMLSGLSTATGIFCMLLITKNSVNHYYYEGINLCITWTLFIVGLRFFNALHTVLIIIVVYNLIALYKHLMFTEILSHNFFLISNAVIGIFAGYTIEQHSRWQFYQALVIQKNSRRLHQAMLEASLDSVISVDETGVVVEFNQSAEIMFGYSRQEAIGQKVGNLIIPEPMRARHEEGFYRFAVGEDKSLANFRVEVEAMRKDGSLFPVEIILRGVNLIGRWLVTAYIRDLTLQHNAEKEIIRQREILQRNEKLSALGALLGGVAHELNNPLSVVLGQTQLLSETEQDPRILKRAAKISQAADRCAKVVQTFLAMARQNSPQRALVNINDIIVEALDFLADGLNSKGVMVDRHLQATLPCLQVDADQLHQVITNLVLNAQQAMQDCAVKKLSVLTYINNETQEIVIEIADTGPGIPPELQHRIFEPFFTTKESGMGTGLGLSVCNGIIEAHGGAIMLIDQKLKGACIRISLPIDTN